MGWWVYMLRCGDGTLYTGTAVDVNRRAAAHAGGKGAKYTRGRGPIAVVYREECPDKGAALRREAAIKKLKRPDKLNLIAAYTERRRNMKKAAFIGTGNMGAPLVGAACKALGAEQVVITNRTRAKAEALAERLGCAVAEDNRSAAAQAEVVFLCVKPQMLRGVAEELAPVLGAGQTVVSIAAGLTLETIRGWLAGAPAAPALVRIMPNTPAAIGRGMLALSAEAGTPEARIRAVEAMLAPAGLVERIAEGQMDAFSAVAGCGPAFVYPFIEALADGGVMVGLPRGQAMTYAAQMVLGAAAMVLESGKHPGQLKDEVCSPGGSTIAGVAALEKNGFRSAAIQAVPWRKTASAPPPSRRFRRPTPEIRSWARYRGLAGALPCPIDPGRAGACPRR